MAASFTSSRLPNLRWRSRATSRTVIQAITSSSSAATATLMTNRRP